MGTLKNRTTIRPQFTLTFLLMLVVVLSSCVQGTGTRKSTSKSGSNLTGSGSGSGTGSGSLPNGGTIGSGGTLQSVKVELSHLVDPFEGTYKKKLTIPKNFKGNLYLAGLNVSALADKIVKVRFNFGLDRQSVVLNATVGRAPGIIPQTDIQVLMVDMNSKPFSKMRLNYDLYDYNDYSDASKEPVVDPRNGSLYCRGLQLEDDPTFNAATAANGNCSTGADKCLYAYAKVVDATLYNGGITSIPTRPQIWTDSSGVRSPSLATSNSSVCLPDLLPNIGFNELLGLPLSTVSGYGSPVGSLTYQGPYRAINTTSWKISSDAIFASGKGLFESLPFVSPFDVNNPATYIGYKSYLFPRAGKITLNQDVKYLGGSDKFGARTGFTASSSGTSDYVDGCNLRVMNYDVATTESIGSCNVNANIEVFYMKDGVEVNITTDNSIKLQLIRPSTLNFEGKEVLNTAFKRCENSSVCGSDECCFNQRCWSKDLVTQCVDQMPVIGNQPVGFNCSSDYECSSLCCNASTGTCAPHNPNGTAPAFCAKTPGQKCVSQEFCQPQYVATCKIVKLPTPNPDGSVACTLRCPAVETYGTCVAGYCKPPAIPPVPAFNPADCSLAVDP